MEIRDTSIAAYYNLLDSGVLGNEEMIVFAFLMAHPDSSDRDIFMGTRLDQRSSGARRNQLNKDGAIMSSGKKRCPYTGRTVYMWVVNPYATVEAVRANRKRSYVQCPHCNGSGHIQRH